MSLDWGEMLQPVTEEPTTTLSLDGGNAPAFVNADAPPPPTPSPPPAPSSPPAPLSLATRHNFAPAAFAVGVVEACAMKHSASSCVAARELYGCTWNGASCIVDCGTFHSQVGCDTQPGVCAHNATTGACSYIVPPCAKYTSAAACTTTVADGGCIWFDGSCYAERHATAVCHSKTKEQCASASGNAGEMPCLWHVNNTFAIGGEVVYIGHETNVTSVERLPGECVVRRACGEFTKPESCGSRSPMCVYDHHSRTCARSRAYAEHHRLCATLGPQDHRTCPPDDEGAKTFCNFNFGGRGGFCQRCAGFDNATACNALPYATGRDRCSSKCLDTAL